MHETKVFAFYVVTLVATKRYTCAWHKRQKQHGETETTQRTNLIF